MGNSGITGSVEPRLNETFSTVIKVEPSTSTSMCHRPSGASGERFNSSPFTPVKKIKRH